MKKTVWKVYMLRCRDGSLYTGIAKDVASRFVKHKSGKGAAYTRSHPPIRLIYEEGPFTLSGALKREAAIKRLPRRGKIRLVKGASVPVVNSL